MTVPAVATMARIREVKSKLALAGLETAKRRGSESDGMALICMPLYEARMGRHKDS